MKAVLQHRASSGFRNELARVAPEWLQISVVDEADKAGFFGAMQDAEVLLHVLEPVTAEAIARAPKLRLIQKIGVGLNTIDLEAARTRGIAVANMPGTNSQAVAELTLSLMLAALRCIPYLDREIRAGRGWHLPVDTFDRMGEIGGRTVGLIGYGEVPRRLAPALAALGARIVYTSRAPKPDAIADAMTLAELLSTSDIVSLHVPLTTETEKLINEKTIARMKRGSVLVNTARGRLVDEDALIAALRSGRILAAGLDVFFDEPALAQHPLYALDNVVLTPHVAWLTRETLQRSMGVAIENCRRLAQRQRLLHEVIPERQ
jgi:phosphoglycerate dehydrogenase-like enzyme